MNETDNDIKIQIKNENICVIHVNLKLDKIANYLVMRDNHAHPSRKWRKQETESTKTSNLRRERNRQKPLKNHRLKSTHV